MGRSCDQGPHGLHTGEAEERGQDYFGPTLNRCARLMSAAHGGQIVLSATTAELLRGAVEDVEIVDLGFHRLRDVTEPVSVAELRIVGRPQEFPALRSPGRGGNLPAAPDQFIAREVAVTACSSG